MNELRYGTKFLTEEAAEEKYCYQETLSSSAEELVKWFQSRLAGATERVADELSRGQL